MVALLVPASGAVRAHAQGRPEEGRSLTLRQQGVVAVALPFVEVDHIEVIILPQPEVGCVGGPEVEGVKHPLARLGKRHQADSPLAVMLDPLLDRA